MQTQERLIHTNTHDSFTLETPSYCNEQQIAENMNTRKDTCQQRMDDDKQDTVIIWHEPGKFWSTFSNWTWCWSFCPFFYTNNNHNHKTLCIDDEDDPITPSVTSDEQSSLGENEEQVRALTTIDNVVPVIRQPPPIQVQTTWSSNPETHPSIVYIYNIPSNTTNRPSIMHLSDRLTSVDTLTVSGDERDDDSDSNDEEEDNDVPPPPPPPPFLRNQVPPRPPLRSVTSTSSNVMVTRPPLVSCRTATFGSCTTQSSRHRRSIRTVSPQDVASVYGNNDYNDDDTILSEASPFPQLDDGESLSSKEDDLSVAKSKSSLPPPPPPPELVNASEGTTTLQEDEEWMEAWMQDWISGAPIVDGGELETRQHTPKQERHDEICDSSSSHEARYLPKSLRLEQSLVSSVAGGDGKIVFAAWLLFVPDNGPIPTTPSRRDVIHLMIVEGIPKLFLARSDGEMTTLDVTRNMRVSICDISKSHGRGVTITSNDGTLLGTLVPISLPQVMFDENDSLVDDDEFQHLAYLSIAPFCKNTSPKNKNSWRHSAYHQEYAPMAQLEAAMHLLFVLDCFVKTTSL